MRQEIIEMQDKKITRLFLERDDEVQTSEDSLRNIAIYIEGCTFQLSESTDLEIPYCTLGDNEDPKYLDVLFNSEGAFVDIPEGYHYVEYHEGYLILKKPHKKSLHSGINSLYNWKQDVITGLTQLGYSAWLEQKEA